MKPHVVLLTGAAGAVGRPLLEELLRRPDIARVVVLEHVDRVSPRDGTEIVHGDVTCPDLGLSPADATRLAHDTTTILHAAADTRFGGSTGVRPGFDQGQTGVRPGSDHLFPTERHGAAPRSDPGATPVEPRSNPRRTPVEPPSNPNVVGVRRVVEYAGRCRNLDRVLALSTAHVAGRRTGCILESELEHDAGFVNAYEESQYEAERALRRRMADLPISVCRLSTVVGDSTTGRIDRAGAIHHAVRLMYAGLAPMIPGREDSPVDLLASDYVARALSVLATDAFEAGQTWHLCAGGDTIPAGELIDLTLDTFLRCRPAWRRRTIERPVVADLDTFALFCRSADDAGDTTLRAAATMMMTFAPQLAFPKRFDDRACAAALRDRGVIAPRARDTWTRVVERIVGAAA